MNKLILLGRLTADPELKQTQSGVSSCRFTVAVNRKFKDKQTGDYPADFINCQAWRQTAEFIAKYFRKGDMIAIEGSVQNNNYESNGVKQYTYIVSVENVEFGGSRNSNQSSQPAPQQPTAQQSASADNITLGDFEEILADGEVPF